MTTNSFWTGSYVPLFREALQKVLPKLSAQVTENRQTTIGASEIGACALKVIRGKRQPVPHDDDTCLRFLLGHTRETSLALVHDQVCADHGWYRVDQQPSPCDGSLGSEPAQDVRRRDREAVEAADMPGGLRSRSRGG